MYANRELNKFFLFDFIDSILFKNINVYKHEVYYDSVVSVFDVLFLLKFETMELKILLNLYFEKENR